MLLGQGRVSTRFCVRPASLEIIAIVSELSKGRVKIVVELAPHILSLVSAVCVP